MCYFLKGIIWKNLILNLIIRLIFVYMPIRTFFGLKCGNVGELRNMKIED